MEKHQFYSLYQCLKTLATVLLVATSLSPTTVYGESGWLPKSVQLTGNPPKDAFILCDLLKKADQESWRMDHLQEFQEFLFRNYSMHSAKEVYNFIANTDDLYKRFTQRKGYSVHIANLDNSPEFWSVIDKECWTIASNGRPSKSLKSSLINELVQAELKGFGIGVVSLAASIKLPLIFTSWLIQLVRTGAPVALKQWPYIRSVIVWARRSLGPRGRSVLGPAAHVPGLALADLAVGQGFNKIQDSKEPLTAAQLVQKLKTLGCLSYWELESLTGKASELGNDSDSYSARLAISHESKRQLGVRLGYLPKNVACDEQILSMAQPIMPKH